MSSAQLYSQLPYTLTQTGLPSLGLRRQGKVRDTYREGNRLVLVATDRLSAFDKVLTTIPFKGQILTQLAQFWFQKTSHLAPNHLLDVPDPNVMVAHACEPFPVEFVVRGYLTGSLWRDVQKQAPLPYGLDVDPSMQKHQVFPTPLLTPSTKAEDGAHDEPISAAEILARGLMSPRDFARASELAFALFAEGQAWARSRGLLLVDTKYEFGKRKGEVVLIDEIHTPDSSRYWLADSYPERFARGEEPQMLDKENIRQWLIQERGFMGDGPLPDIPDDVRVQLAQKYVSAYERITGQPLSLQVGPVGPRIAENLSRKGLL